MSGSHNVVFLLDTAVSMEKRHLHLCALKILNYLGCRFGLAKIRWDFKFFDSLGAQGRTSRVGSFRELGSRAWEDFEEELENRFGSGSCVTHLPGPAPRATLAQNILKETLLDYQWDRPEIASPAKPVLRSQKSKAGLPVDKPPENSTSGDFVNAVFLFSPCPHSQRELLQFISGSQAHIAGELPPLHDMAEKFIPKGIQDMIASQKITLFWLDTSECSKLLESPDHIGYQTLVELMRLLGGTVLPFATLAQSLNHQRGAPESASPLESSSSQPPFRPWSAVVPFESTLSCLFSRPSALQASFPSQEGTLFLKADGMEKTRTCAVTLQPLTLGQCCLKSPVHICLKGIVTGWNARHTGCFRTENWAVRAKEAAAAVREASLFQHFVKGALAQGLHLIAEVSAAGIFPPRTGIFSSFSGTTVVLSLLFTEPNGKAERFLLQTAAEGSIFNERRFSLPEVAAHVLNQDSDSPEGCPRPSPTEALFPEWVHQELSYTPHWSPAVVESWYSVSNLCGASPHLMESFGMLRAGSARKDENPKLERNLTNSLSEFYQRKSSGHSARFQQQEHRKRHGVPRTPVRQKMKKMPRSLQMLNTARLNAKAQKFQPEGEQPTSEKVSQRLFPKRRDNSAEERGKTAKGKPCFRSEEEMLASIRAQYQRAVTAGENVLRFAQEMVMAVNSFQKASEEAAVDTIRSSLLRSSQRLRQQLAHDSDKEAKIKECQLQVYLRLEMCLRCPPLQTGPDGTDELVEEVTEMLRILCLTKDPGYLARFLDEVVDTYLESMPKLLGDLYYSLGTQVPPKLASVLPADLSSDDDQEGQTSVLPASVTSAPSSRPASLTASTHQLEELRSRSAKKRKSTLARHRSVTDAPQNLRQIEVPQVPRNRSRKELCKDMHRPASLPDWPGPGRGKDDASEAASWLEFRPVANYSKESSRPGLNATSEPAAKKVVVQEVTKVRRNLFNEKMLSPGKRSLAKIPRSQSVSAVEGLKRKHSQSGEGTRGSYRLLTKSVAETPLHKQISRRLLHKQIKGRCSDPGPEVDVVEESPEKPITCLRRSPRIKRLLLGRTPSSSVCNVEESSQNCIQQRYSVHKEGHGDQEKGAGLMSPPVKKGIRSPKSLLFGAVLEDFNSEEKGSPRTSRLSSDQPAVCATPRKSPFRSSRRLTSPPGITPRRSPRIYQKAQDILQKTPTRKCGAAKSLGSLLSPCRPKSKPEFVDKKEGNLSGAEVTSPSRLPAHQPALRRQGRREVLDNVFASPASDPDAAALLSVTTPPGLHNADGKVRLGLPSPRRSLRVAYKSASPTSTQKQMLESQRGAFSGPKSTSPVGPFSPADQTAFLPASRLGDQAVSAPATWAFSPARTPGGRLSLATDPPWILPKVAGASLVKASQSPDCVAGDNVDLSGHNDECQGRESSGRSAKNNPFSKPLDTESQSSAKSPEDRTKGLTLGKRRDSERGISTDSSWKNHGHILDALVLCEPLDTSSLYSKTLSRSPGANKDQEASSQGLLPAEKVASIEHPPFRSPPCSNQTPLLTTPTSGLSTYALRCTPDRRQREAAARLGNPELTAAFCTSRAARTLRSTASSPTYEVELEMQASGLPKLRIKRVPSESVPEVPPRKTNGEESSQGEISLTWCSRHAGRPADPPSASPSCVRSAHSTPGKPAGAGQTYICQSYTPTRYASCTASPSQGGLGVPWTPSPRRKGKVTPEAIQDWPRRKRAGVGCGRNERQAGALGETAPGDVADTRTLEPFGGSKLLLPGEFELEGVYRLPDQSPGSDAEPSREEGHHREMAWLGSRKRALGSPSPEEGATQAVKRSCLKVSSPRVAADASEWLITGKGLAASSRTVQEAAEVFDFSGLTPPSSSGKSTISASSLWALTESPLLYPGHSASLKKHPTGEDSEVFGAASEDLSPFHRPVTRRHSLARTYSRKKLLT